MYLLLPSLSPKRDKKDRQCILANVKHGFDLPRVPFRLPILHGRSSYQV